MSVQKNNTDNNISENPLNQLNKNQTSTDNRSIEIDLPLPEKKNDTITTGSKTEKFDSSNKLNEINNSVKQSENRKEKTEVESKILKKFENNDSHSDENSENDKEKTSNLKTKEISWQQEKINEANNQLNNLNSDVKTEKMIDNRNDSILIRPKTETYEKNENDDIGRKIHKENFNHVKEEEKRELKNRNKNHQKVNKI